MAVMVTLPTNFGESRELYVRLNNFEQLANHGIPAIARFRGFISKEAYQAGAHFVFEDLVEFQVDVTKSVWAQAYVALKEKAALAGAVDA